MKKRTFERSGGCDFSQLVQMKSFTVHNEFNSKANKHNQGVLGLISSIVP